MRRHDAYGNCVPFVCSSRPQPLSLSFRRLNLPFTHLMRRYLMRCLRLVGRMDAPALQYEKQLGESVEAESNERHHPDEKFEVCEKGDGTSVRPAFDTPEVVHPCFHVFFVRTRRGIEHHREQDTRIYFRRCQPRIKWELGEDKTYTSRTYICPPIPIVFPYAELVVSKDQSSVEKFCSQRSVLSTSS